MRGPDHPVFFNRPTVASPILSYSRVRYRQIIPNRCSLISDEDSRRFNLHFPGRLKTRTDRIVKMPTSAWYLVLEAVSVQASLCPIMNSFTFSLVEISSWNATTTSHMAEPAKIFHLRSVPTRANTTGCRADQSLLPPHSTRFLLTSCRRSTGWMEAMTWIGISP